MNNYNFIQQDDFLLGNKQKIEELKTKNHARILVLSDSHGKFNVVKQIINQYGKTCDALIFCGDGIGDIATILSSSFDDDFFACIPKVISFARGNGDPSNYPVTENQTIKIPEKQILQVNNQKILIVHGHKQGIDFDTTSLKFEMQLLDCKTAFFGHTHIAQQINEDGFSLINPGSCSRPRGNQSPGFAIATVEKSFVDVAFIKMNILDAGKNQFSLWTPF